MPLCSASVWQMLVSHICLRPSLQTLEASVLLTSTPVRPAGGAGRDSGIPGMQHSWYSVCITPTLSSLPEILHLYHWIYVCVERLCCIYVEGCKNSFRSRLLEIQRNKSHFLFITAYSNWGGFFCPPNTGEPKGIQESWGEHANSTEKTWDGIKPRTSVLSLIKCGHSP